MLAEMKCPECGEPLVNDAPRGARCVKCIKNFQTEWRHDREKGEHKQYWVEVKNKTASA